MKQTNLEKLVIYKWMSDIKLVNIFISALSNHFVGWTTRGEGGGAAQKNIDKVSCKESSYISLNILNIQYIHLYIHRMEE